MSRDGVRVGHLSASLLTLEEASAWMEPWRRLAEAAIEPNVFYGPEVTLAACRHLQEGAGTRILAAWDERDGDRRLVGILPVVRGGLRHANEPGLRRAPAYLATLSMPLLAANDPGDVLAVMLLACAKAGIPAVCLPFFPLTEPASQVLGGLRSRGGFAVATLGRHRRALLRSGLDGRSHLRALFKAPARNKHERQRRKLAEEGEVGIEVAEEGNDVQRSLATFLALEQSGWKGRAGTALARLRGGEAFIRDAAGALAPASGFRVVTLRAGERAVAALLVLVSQRRAFLLKMAHDETFARSSPGLLLMLAATERLLDDPALDESDSLAAPGHPIVDRIWPDRLEIASLVVATRPGPPSLRFRFAVAIERGREALVARLKGLRSRRSEGGAPAA